MADVKDLFESGEDVTGLFEGGQDVASAPPVSDSDYSGLSGGAKAAGLGAAKGATFGFDDELWGAISAAVKKAGGSSEDTFKLYQQARDQARAEHAAAEEQRPYVSMAGELAGGFAVPGMAVGKGLVKGASLGMKLSNAAKVGAAAGALGGLGTSTADLTTGEPGQIGEAAIDTATGAGTGAVMGVGMQGLGSAIKSTAGAAKDVALKFPIGRKTAETFNRSRAGETFDIPSTSKDTERLANEVITELEDLRAQAGRMINQGTKNLEEKGVKVDIEKGLADLRAKVKAAKPATPEEEADLTAVKKTLDNILQQEEKDIVRLIPKATPPKPTGEEKALAKITKKTAEAEAKDTVLKEQLQNAIDALEAAGADNDEIMPLVKKLRTLEARQTEFPPQNITETLTGSDVLAVPRGLSAPLVEGMPATPEPLFTPLQRIKNTVTETGRPELGATEANKIISSVGESLDKRDTKLGKELTGDIKTTLQKLLGEAAEEKGANPEALSGAKKLFGEVSETQKKLQLPDRFGTDTSARTQAENKLQSQIRRYFDQGSSESQDLDEALKQLEKAYPASAKALRDKISNTSTRESIARGMYGQSSLGGNKGPLGLLQASEEATRLHTTALAGKAVGAVERKAKAIANVPKDMYNASPESLQRMAEAAGRVAKPFADTLNKIAAHGDQAKRRALMFTLAQQPAFREFAEEYAKEEMGMDK